MNKKIVISITAILIALISGYYLLSKEHVLVRDKVIVRIGVLAPLSGENATYGDATMKGIDMALDEISKKADYNNFKIELIKEDSKLEAGKAVNGIQKLISIDKVPVIIGPFGSSEVLAVSQSANQGKTPIISASATADAIADAGDYVFRIVPSNQEQGSSMADFVVKKLNIKDSIVILALNNDYGVSLSRAFKNRIIDLGCTIVYEDKFNEKEKDFKTLILKVKNLNPKFIYLPDHYNESGLFLKQAKELGLSCSVGGGDGSYSPDLISIAGSGSNGFYLTLMGIDNSNPNTERFKEVFSKKYNKDFDVYSAYSYDCMFVIAEALRQLSSAELKAVDGSKIRSLLLGLTFNGITGTNKFDAKGEVKKAFNIYQVQDLSFKIHLN